MNTQNPLPQLSIKRMNLYLPMLKLLKFKGHTDVSVQHLTTDLGIPEKIVDSDLSLCNPGLPEKYAYNINDLIGKMEAILGYHNMNEAFLVGAGNLGAALMRKENLGQTDLKIVAAFEIDYRKIGTEIENTRIMSFDKLPGLAKRMHVNLGLIATPADQAQQVADVLVAAGIKAIWNFASFDIQVPEDVIVHKTVKGENISDGYFQLLKKIQPLITPSI